MPADFRKANLAGTPHEGLTEAQLSDGLASLAAIVTLLEADGNAHGARLAKLLWPIR